MRRNSVFYALCVAASLLCLPAVAASRFESVVLSLQIPVDQAHIAKMEKDLREIPGFGGVTWDLPSKKCTVLIDAGVICRDDLIKALNQRSLDGNPVVAAYSLPDPKVSLAEIKKLLPEMDAEFQKTKQPKDLLPYLERMGPHVEALGEAVRQKDPPTKNGKMGPTYEKARELAVRVYVLQSVAKREYTQTTEKALAGLKAAVDDLGAALDPQPKPAQTP